MNFFEFPNEYGLKEKLDRIESICEKIEACDFIAAKAEYENTYSINQLLTM